MKFNYKLKRLCGAYYGHSMSSSSTASAETAASSWNGSNLIYDSTGNLLISSVSNRVQVIDLRSNTVRTLPIEARSNIHCLALSPDDTLLLAIDVKGYGLVINFHRGIVLHRMHYKRKVRAIEFSPDGRYFMVTAGKHIQVWCTPTGRVKEFAPVIFHRTYTGQSDDVSCLTWSPDSTVLAAGSKDGSVRLWTLHTTTNYEPCTLSGHKRAVVGVYLVPSSSSSGSSSSSSVDNMIDSCYSVSQDGALVTWECNKEQQPVAGGLGATTADGGGAGSSDHRATAEEDAAVNFFTGGNVASSSGPRTHAAATTTSQAENLVNAKWSIRSRHYFHQENTDVTATCYCAKQQLLTVGFSSGLFGVYEMPSAANIHTLSVGTNQLVRTCVLNRSGDWLALGCPRSQQLLVWEWRSETYVLKQRGHAYGMRCMAYSPDGIVICTGGEDAKLKLWNATSGFCYATLEKSHTAPITAVVFANASVVLSASLDGTVRAHDLHRYRTFKTFTTPTPVQFLSLAVDPSGELVLAGSTDPFHIYAWNLQTGKLIDVFTGHTGPVCDLTFAQSSLSGGSGGGTLVSGSWDGTVKLFDIYKQNVPTESLQHTADVVCTAYRPDGKEICAGTIGGLLSFWDVGQGKLKFEIDGRRDIAGGRKINDRMTADNNAASRYFTSICYSADGQYILAGGNSKYVCIYEVSQQILVKKFQVTFNRSLDGVLDELNSKNLGSGGPLDDHADDSGDETTYNALNLPGAKRGDDGSRKSKMEVLTMQVAFSSTGREWATISHEGLHVYSLDDDMIFDPISLTEDITPANVESKLSTGEYAVALRMSLHLNEFSLVRDVLELTPYASITQVVRGLGPNEHMERLMQYVAKIMTTSPHIEFYLQWCLQLLQTHGVYMDRHRGVFMRAFRAMHKAIQTRHDDLLLVCDQNKYALEFITDHAQLLHQTSGAEEESGGN